MIRDTEPPSTVLDQYDLDPASIEPLPGGLINRSFAARRRDQSACVLQRVNAIFPPEVNDDIDAVTAHLAAKGVTTPRMLRTTTDACCVVIDDAVWRLMTRIDGATHEILRTRREAAEAGRVLGEFHRALADFEGPLSHRRPGVHDLERHLTALRDALATHRDHEAHGEISDFADRILALAGRLEPLPEAIDRVVHGDAKASNVMFDKDRAVGLIDLDTIARMPVALELGDAFRSWCNPAGEDSLEARFSPARFDAALEGYTEGAPGLLSAAEWRSVPDATLQIAVELAARFAADALVETYFSWDRERFVSASRHNRLRAASQLALAEDIERHLKGMRERTMTQA